MQKKCDPIIAVGGLMSTNVKAAATANPNVHFAEVDAPSAVPNMYGMQFNTAQGGFLGGYLAAGMTKTGKVATFGGADIPPVTIYMDGFWEGVQYYNSAEGHERPGARLGREATRRAARSSRAATPSVTRTAASRSARRSSTRAPTSSSRSPVAPVWARVRRRRAPGGKVSVIWVDTDGCVSAAQYCKVLPDQRHQGPVQRGADLPEGRGVKGTFPTGSYIGTLQNGGTGLADYHDFASKVPAALQTEVNEVKADIDSGAITITSPSQPK